ncbi:hypothetical protein GCM10022225_57340 [Plantactinospora mayteni]|uniref:Uncharacterized protein n=1 Tax=Plantactinospora mayteni TaxID=566021 RepID=A0ABQ4F1R9_9ACTN|nr:hypothetical protein [Plantactinospora mayteni]GIH00862.1 hypothetical protein Pma05_74340 [Plantactinospora mayteni]
MSGYGEQRNAGRRLPVLIAVVAALAMVWLHGGQCVIGLATAVTVDGVGGGTTNANGPSREQLESAGQPLAGAVTDTVAQPATVLAGTGPTAGHGGVADALLGICVLLVTTLGIILAGVRTAGPSQPPTTRLRLGRSAARPWGSTPLLAQLGVSRT